MAKKKKKQKERSYDGQIDDLIQDLGIVLRKENDEKAKRAGREYEKEPVAKEKKNG